MSAKNDSPPTPLWLTSFVNGPLVTKPKQLNCDNSNSNKTQNLKQQQNSKNLIVLKL